MEQRPPILEYRKEPRRGMWGWLRMAAGHYAGAVVGTIAADFAAMIITGDMEGAGFMPMVIPIFAAGMLVPGLMVWGSLWMAGRVGRRVPPRNGGVIAFFVGLVVSAGAVFGAMISRIAEFQERPAGWTYWLGAYVLVPVGIYLAMVRRGGDVDAALTHVSPEGDR